VHTFSVCDTVLVAFFATEAENFGCVPVCQLGMRPSGRAVTCQEVAGGFASSPQRAGRETTQEGSLGVTAAAVASRGLLPLLLPCLAPPSGSSKPPMHAFAWGLTCRETIWEKGWEVPRRMPHLLKNCAAGLGEPRGQRGQSRESLQQGAATRHQRRGAQEAARSAAANVQRSQAPAAVARHVEGQRAAARSSKTCRAACRCVAASRRRPGVRHVRSGPGPSQRCCPPR
jgi:hypothetical protein